MANALEEDLESNHRQQPALAKLRLLPQVTSLLEKSYLHELILDHEVLSLMRQWLEPLADGSLPSLDIRRSFVDALFKLPITSDHLRESRIGRVIMFMYKCEKELPELRKKCGDLIGLWTRPFLNSRQTAATQRPQQDHLSLGSTGPVLHDPEYVEFYMYFHNNRFSRVRVGDPGYDTKHARIPKAALVEYAAPPSSVVDTGDMQKSAAGSRYRRMASALGRSKSKTDSRLNKVSIEGRGL
jgi:transcription factor SPN1